MKPIFLMLAALGLGVLPAKAQDWRSVYTEIDLERCTMIYAYELGGDFACPGYRGFPVLIREGDLRYAVSYGFGAYDEKAARQYFPQFNAPGTRIEWLIADDPELGESPVGTILRFYLAAPDYGDPDDQVLVITKIAEGNTCQVARIDALANPDANAIARETAAELIPDFDCASTDPQIVGAWTIP